MTARQCWNSGPVTWRPTTVSLSNRHSTIGTRQAEYHEALPSSANVQSHFTSSFADDGNASVCRVPIVERLLDCENCRHLTVVGLHDTGPTFPIVHCTYLKIDLTRLPGRPCLDEASAAGLVRLKPPSIIYVTVKVRRREGRRCGGGGWAGGAGGGHRACGKEYRLSGH